MTACCICLKYDQPSHTYSAALYHAYSFTKTSELYH